MCKYCAIILIATAIKKKREKRKRSVWSKQWFLKRDKLGQQKILKELEFSAESDFKNYVRMSKETFDELLAKVAPLIKKNYTIMRKAIPVHHRLALTLRFLASGNSFEDLKFLTAIAPQTIGGIVFETCEAIIEVLKTNIALPSSEEDWKKEANAFYQRWNFPNCIGAMDGKHVAITKPPGTGSFYFNYKKFFSIVLMAVVNANYEFLMVDVGKNGRASDAGIFSDSLFFMSLKNNELKIPSKECPPGCDTALPYVFVADDAFPLTENVMKPFSPSSMIKDEIIFNYRLSRARGVVENTFGILSSRFRILLKTINLSPEKTTIIVLTCCHLHNFLRKKNDQVYANSNLAGTTETEVLAPVNRTVIRNHATNAKDIRSQFCKYFNSEGSVSWQNSIYEKLTNKNVNDSTN
ncbi:putative nuclease HARBI1 [Bactrocera dorsalis]|uniref:Nuclease HARBI1 n=1 Tax=Bactrocera dorsalis TaxID=27457 RepID=A0ABM3J479_BACDO|nr:putative nuclease HARBI1 [Bactrocera dorsalis]